MKKDIVIIGGGPGGYVAAIRAAQLGAHVCVVEVDAVGGTCLNKGCIPTKVFYRNASYLEELKKSEIFGVTIDGFKVDFQQFMDRKNDVVNKLVSGVEKLLARHKIEVIKGKGKIEKKGKVSVRLENNEEVIIEAEHIIIATGSNPAMPKIDGIELENVITSDELLEQVKPPKSVVIIGGGVIGLEFAGILNAYGVAVTVVEFMPKVLPNLDQEISKKMALAMKKKGITVKTNTSVDKIEKSNNGLKVVATAKNKCINLECEQVLVATGRSINIGGLNLDAIGIDYTNKGIVVDDNYETNVSGIYAIGDVIGGQMLAHVASEEGIVAVEKILGHSAELNYMAVPGCVFSFPEVATVGYSEERLKSEGIAYTSGKFMFGANGKALSMGEGEGFVKVLAEKESKKVLGMHIMGPHASDLIHEGALAISNGLTIEGIIKTIHAHPTLQEAVLEATLSVDNRGIHSVAKR